MKMKAAIKTLLLKRILRVVFALKNAAVCNIALRNNALCNIALRDNALQANAAENKAENAAENNNAYQTEYIFTGILPRTKESGDTNDRVDLPTHEYGVGDRTESRRIGLCF
ncbi:MAG: hypothetical protein IKD47_05855 [Clostridia bacterium]|nr:hypothetical protein [Clostridia bacterium]